MTAATDAVGNTITAAIDYRALQPRLVVDANANRSAAAFDAMGLVTAIAVMGPDGSHEGDTLDGVAVALVRGTGSGGMRVKVEADGLTSGTVALQSVEGSQ